MRRSLLDDDLPDSSDQAPGWMVSYGDMMSLLLTLFVMLVSMSEIKQNDKFQGVADSLHEQFSINQGPAGDPDDVLPRNAALAGLAVAGRQTRQAVLGVGGTQRTSRVSGNAERSAIAQAAIAFDPASAEFSHEAEKQFQEVAGWSGRTNPVGLETLVAASDELQLAWRRVQATADRLVRDFGMDRQRLRISISVKGDTNGANGSSSPPEKPMVNVFLIREP